MTIPTVSLSKVSPEVRARVQAGIDWLDSLGSWPHEMDEYDVSDWRDRIDLEYLSIIDGYQCVLGQVFGGYYEAQEKYPAVADIYQRHDLGFTEAEREDMSELQQAWIEALS